MQKKFLKSLGKKLSQIIIYVSCEETICREHQTTLKMLLIKSIYWLDTFTRMNLLFSAMVVLVKLKALILMGYF